MGASDKDTQYICIINSSACLKGDRQPTINVCSKINSSPSAALVKRVPQLTSRGQVPASLIADKVTGKGEHSELALSFYHIRHLRAQMPPIAQNQSLLVISINLRHSYASTGQPMG